MNNHIVLDKQSYTTLQYNIAKNNQISIKTIYNQQQNIIQEVRIKNLDKDIFVDINAPFAAGTYIRLEAIQHTTTNTADINANTTTNTTITNTTSKEHSIHTRQQANPTKSTQDTDFENLKEIYWREVLLARKSSIQDFITLRESNTTKTTTYTKDFYLSTPKEIDSLRQKG